MTRETITYLNSGAILLGQTANRGSGNGSWRAWWDVASLQGESPYYEGFIPVSEIERRTFNFQAVPRRVAVEVPATIETMMHLSDDGLPMRWEVQPDRQAIARDDNNAVMGIFMDGYKAHQLGETLIGRTSNILGDTIGITSAGVIKGGAVGWIEVGIPETQSITKLGIDYRPNLLAGTSFDGSVATFWKRTVTKTLCDNTFEIARSIAGQVFKIRHSKNSGFKIKEARQALNILEQTSEDFEAEVTQLVQATVTDAQWRAFLDVHVPIVKDDGERLTGRGLTMATRKREQLARLWSHDHRVSPWQGTAWGVLQAVNTWGHHLQTVRGATRLERNAMNAIRGEQAKTDTGALAQLDRILA
jgi:phage/plasmid-like protein (TIGR03299 family)